MPLREEDSRAAVRPKRSSKLPLVIAGVVVLVVAVVIYALTRGGSPEPTTPEDQATTSTAPTSSATTPSSSTETSEWAATQNDTIIREVAPGLNQCLATVDGNQTDAVDGVRIGFPRTLEGGISAILNYTKYQESMGVLLPDVAARVDPHLYKEITDVTGVGDAQFRADLREAWRINEQGDALLENGAVDPHNAAYYDTYPEYGAYHVDRVSYGDEGDPYYVIATVWMPRVLGHGNDDDMSQVRLYWVTWQMAVEWNPDTEEWNTLMSMVIQESPQPGQPTFSNQSFEARAKALGPGWCVPGDAREDAIPGTAKTK